MVFTNALSKLQYVGGPPNGSFDERCKIDFEYHQEQSFQKLKAALCQASTLAYHDLTRTFVVHLDASNVELKVEFALSILTTSSGLVVP